MNSRLPLLPILLLLGLLAGLPAQSQEIRTVRDLRFKHFQTEDGLVSLSMTAFLQDRSGLIWLGTENGVVQYDGFRFHPIQEMSGRKVTALYEDEEGLIWIGTKNNGLYRYAPATADLLRLPLALTISLEALENQIISIAADGAGILCVGTAGGLFRLFPQPPSAERPYRIERYLPQKFPAALYYLADSLEKVGAQLGQLVVGRTRDREFVFDVDSDDPLFVLSSGIKMASFPSGFFYRGWIENAEGKIVWDMAVERTLQGDCVWPNGAYRVQGESLRLPRGQYRLRYQMDRAIADLVPPIMGRFHGIRVLQADDRLAAQIERHMAEARKKATILEQRIDVVYTDETGVTWLGGGGGLTKMFIPDLSDPERVTFEQFQPFPKRPGNINSIHIYAISPSRKKGGLWIGGASQIEGGTVWGKIFLEHFDPESGHFTSYKNGLETGRFINQIYEDPEGGLWLGTGWDKGDYWDIGVGTYGLYHLQEPLLEEGQAGRANLDYYNLQPGNSTRGNIGVNFIEADGVGSVWIGTTMNGLYQYDPNFNWFSHKPILNPSITDNIQAFCYVEDAQGGLWIGTQGQGLFKIQPDGTARPVPGVGEEINDLLLDRKGHIWVATSKGELIRLDPTSQQISRVSVPSQSNPFPFIQSLSDGVVFDLEPASDGQFFVASSLGIFLFDPQTSTFTQSYFRLSGSPVDNWDGLPSSLSWEPPNVLWVGFLKNVGLYRSEFRYEGDQVQIDAERVGEYCTVEDLYRSADGTLWAATLSGLAEISGRELKDFYTYHDGLLHNEVYSIAEDDRGNLWLTSPKGLSRFNPKTREFQSLSRFDGTLLPQVMPGNIQQLKDGRMICSSEDGYCLFDPHEVRTTKTVPQIALTGLRISNQEVAVNPDGPLQQALAYTSSLTLSHYQNDLTFEFVGLNSPRPEKIRYRYQLVGNDPHWIDAGAERSARYTNLAPGHYTLRVQASQEGADWSQEATLQLCIRPPWWATWWAFAGYGLALVGILYFLYRIQMNRQLSRAESRRIKELHDFQTRVYTNITHEFRTPITIILGMTGQIRENPERWFNDGLEMIDRNGQNLLRLVNQMLDLSKLESGKMDLQMVQSDIIHFLKYLVESFHSYAESRDVQLHFLADWDEWYMDYDPDKLQQILGNLLSNAIKYTPAGGQVYVDVRQPDREASDASQLVIRVRDTGVGIPEDQIPQLFDRFYQVRKNDQPPADGTGIGLAITMELVKLMKGRVEVKSKVGRGSEFTVVLPVNRKAPRKALEAPPARPLRLLEPEPRSNPPAVSDQPPKLQPSAGSDASLPLVLLIEDNPDVVQYLRSCLQDQYQIQVATNGRSGIEKGLELVPDLIVSDVMMPEKDGFEVCRTLKADSRTSHIPIVLLTAKADVESRLEGLEKGADAYLPKPFLQEELLLRLRKLLELRKKLQQHYLQIAGLDPGGSTPRDIPDPSSVDDHFVEAVRTVVEAHLDDFDFTVEELCREVTLSHSQLHRKLSALTGLSANKFIRYIRLNKAKELLCRPELTVTAVAFDTGFNDPSYFGRIFKKEFGLTPMEWREQHLTDG
ncbi:MAG: response regulator [Saprospiraceae bacterium]|nr:response regulator [Saprospiraceae bacterium]